MNFFYLSVSDLQLLDEWEDPQPEKTKLEKILFTNGMDITKPYEFVWCTHRNLQKQAVECYRVEGQERTDVKWRQSGAASINSYIYSTDDIFFKEDMRRISQQSEADYIEKIKRQLQQEV